MGVFHTQEFLHCCGANATSSASDEDMEALETKEGRSSLICWHVSYNLSARSEHVLPLSCLAKRV